MKALVICESVHHRNREKIARVIAEVLGADLSKPSEVSADKSSKYEHIDIGSGIYFARHHKSFFDIVNKIPKGRG